MLGRFMVNKGVEIQKSRDSNVTLATRCSYVSFSFPPVCVHSHLLIVFFVTFPPYARVSNPLLIYVWYELAKRQRKGEVLASGERKRTVDLCLNRGSLCDRPLSHHQQEMGITAARENSVFSPPRLVFLWQKTVFVASPDKDGEEENGGKTD